MNQLATLAFYATYPGWHSYAKDRATRRAIDSLAKRGFLELSPTTRQARFTGKVFA